jgi:branched-chain amino acid transport system ATP-binding protein
VTLLEVDGLDVRYGDFQALSGVRLHVDRGRAMALIGANGAGKTTLLRTIAGALTGSAGRIRYDGTDITGAPPHRRIRQGIAMVPEGRRLFPSLTVEENILIGASAAASPDWPLDRIYDTFPIIARRRRHRASALSGGEQQAVAIGRALAAGPSLLLLDEISLGLAPRVIAELYEMLAGLRAAGATLVIVEQDLQRALDACDDLTCLLEGRVVLTGPAAGVQRDEVVAAYFGVSTAGRADGVPSPAPGPSGGPPGRRATGPAEPPGDSEGRP